MALALFDFDGTITFKDSFAGFIKYAVGQTQFYLGVACLTPVFFGFLLGLIQRWSRSFRQPPEDFKWFAASVHTASFTFGIVLQ